MPAQFSGDLAAEASKVLTIEKQFPDE